LKLPVFADSLFVAKGSAHDTEWNPKEKWLKGVNFHHKKILTTRTPCWKFQITFCKQPDFSIRKEAF